MAARQGRMLAVPWRRARVDYRARDQCARREGGAARGRTRRQYRAIARLEARQGGRFLLRSLGHGPCDRRGADADRGAAEQRDDLSSLRLWPPARIAFGRRRRGRSEEHTSELQSLMRISYAVFCLKKKKQKTKINRQEPHSQLRRHEQSQ